MEREPKSLMHGKNIAVTAQYIVGFVVHDGHPTHGETLVVNEDCMWVNGHAQIRGRGCVL